MLNHVGYNNYVELDVVKPKEKMTPENFCYWLQGYIEISRANNQPIVITDKEVKVIEDHLSLVLTKVTPNRSTISGIELTHGYPLQHRNDGKWEKVNKNGDIFPLNAGLVNMGTAVSC